MTVDPEGTTAQVTTSAGRVIGIADGAAVVFGRGPDADLTVPAGRGLSRRAGSLRALPGGVLVANLSLTHALYVEGKGFRVRLPRAEEGTEPAGGWFVSRGSVLVGSRAMLDDDQGLRVAVQPAAGQAAQVAQAGQRTAGDPTLMPLYLDPNTKLFLVALIWCRPWLTDPARLSPLPRTPEIARAALEVTGAQHELECFDADPQYRDRLAARVAEHLKVIRRKIAERGLVRPDVRLSDEAAVGVLIEHGVISADDLTRFGDPGWRSRQEDLWWTPAM
ncbi:MAG TPA: hypothetical protein VF843_17215 [Streptosporangiaceae bacterium]